MASDLDVQILRTGNRVVVSVSGDAGLANVSRLEAQLTSVVADAPPIVIVDLSELRFIASRALGTLMGFQRRMTLHGGKVKIVSPRSRVRDSLEIARLHEVLEVFDTVADALKE